MDKKIDYEAPGEFVFLSSVNHISKERDGNAVSNQDISQPYILPGSLVTGMAFGYWQFIAYKYWATFSLSLSLPVSVLQWSLACAKKKSSQASKLR